MKSHNAMKDAEAVDAGWEATRGAIYGAIKWGAVTAVLGGIGYAVSPLYRGLTVQFKVYVFLSLVRNQLLLPTVLEFTHPERGTRQQLHPDVRHGLWQHDRSRPPAARVRGASEDTETTPEGQGDVAEIRRRVWQGR